MSSRPSRGAARLAAILDALPDALVLVNANGTVVNANTIALEVFETPGTALVGRGLLDLLPEFDSRLIPGSMRRPDAQDRARPDQADPDDRPPHRRQRVPRRGHQRESGERPRGLRPLPGYTGDELLMLVVRDLSRHRRHRGRAGAFAAADRDDPAGRVRGRRRHGHRRTGRAGQSGRRPDPRLPGQRPRRTASCTPWSCTPARTARPSRTRSRRSPTPCGPGASTGCAGRCCGRRTARRSPVDLTTAPVRDGDQLVGAVMTFTDRRPYDELAEEKDAAESAREELERLAEEHASELAALRQEHVAELEELERAARRGARRRRRAVRRRSGSARRTGTRRSPPATSS